MANLEVVEAPAPAEAAATAKPNKIVLMGILAGAVVVGVVLGLLVMAPHFAPRSDSGTKDQAGMAKPSSGPGAVIEIENVVVNPAGAEGAHYVMATVAVEVHDKAIEEHLRAREHVVKDLVMSAMSRETMDMLREPGARDMIKANLTRAIDEFTGHPGAVTVYLPEFVVQ